MKSQALPYSVQWLSDVEVPLANKFYREHRFRGSAKRHERCAVVRDIRDERRTIIACGYVRSYNGFELLSGVAVSPDHQRKGVGRLLLQQLSEVFAVHTYTFAYEHLQPFYTSLGFRVCDPENQPSSVGGVYQRYRDQGREITMMVYEPK